MHYISQTCHFRAAAAAVDITPLLGCCCCCHMLLALCFRLNLMTIDSDSSSRPPWQMHIESAMHNSSTFDDTLNAPKRDESVHFNLYKCGNPCSSVSQSVYKSVENPLLLGSAEPL